MPESRYHHDSQTNLDIAILQNLVRRPIKIQEIKNKYNQVYTYSFGKCMIDPKKKEFFRKKEIFS